MYPTWTCTQIDASTTSCASSGAVQVATSTQQVTYLDWIVVNIWIVFLLALIVGGLFFKNFFSSRKLI